MTTTPNHGEITISLSMAALAASVSNGGYGYFKREDFHEALKAFAGTIAIELFYTPDHIHVHDYDSTHEGRSHLDVTVRWDIIDRWVKRHRLGGRHSSKATADPIGTSSLSLKEAPTWQHRHFRQRRPTSLQSSAKWHPSAMTCTKAISMAPSKLGFRSRRKTFGFTCSNAWQKSPLPARRPNRSSYG